VTKEGTSSDWLQELEHNKQKAYHETVSGEAFMAEFPHTLTAQEFVDKLLAGLGKTPSQPERNELIAALGIGSTGRAAVLRKIIEKC
jgi:hypothetical protein